MKCVVARFLDKLEPKVWLTLSGTSSRSIPTTAWCSISARSACRTPREQADYAGSAGGVAVSIGPWEGAPRPGMYAPETRSCRRPRSNPPSAPPRSAVCPQRRCRALVANGRSNSCRKHAVTIACILVEAQIDFSRSGYAAIVRHYTT